MNYKTWFLLLPSGALHINPFETYEKARQYAMGLAAQCPKDTYIVLEAVSTYQTKEPEVGEEILESAPQCD